LTKTRLNLPVQLRARSHPKDGIAYGIDISMAEAVLLRFVVPSGFQEF
jgi:hypothetical protein